MGGRGEQVWTQSGGGDEEGEHGAGPGAPSLLPPSFLMDNLLVNK